MYVFIYLVLVPKIKKNLWQTFASKGVIQCFQKQWIEANLKSSAIRSIS